MALPELTQKLVETQLGEYCNKKVPAHVRDQVRLTFSFMGNTVTLFEERPVYNQLDKRTKIPIAQFRLNVVDHLWRLYCANPKRHEGWVICAQAEPSREFEPLLSALEQDVAGVFWG